MGDNWDDDDFEPDVASLAPPPPEPEPVVPQQVHKAAPKAKKEINMESLGRELTAAEREEMQRRSDLKMARDMFGIDEGEEEAGLPTYDDIITKDEFEEWGIKVGAFLSKRHKAAHYGDLINKLIIGVSEKLDSAEIRKISNHLKALADSKKDEKPKAANAGGAKKKKAQLKGASKGNSEFDDYGGGGAAGRYEDYDDDDFM